jgi:hypothetical protein
VDKRELRRIYDDCTKPGTALTDMVIIHDGKIHVIKKSPEPKGEIYGER